MNKFLENLTIEDLGGELRDAGELRRAAGDHDGRLRLRSERRIRESITDHLEYLLGPLADDVGDLAS